MENKYINGIQTFGPSSSEELVNFAMNKKCLLIAINAEKILRANQELKGLVNDNIGYPDGVGAVWALKQKGLENVQKIPGCELWLDTIEMYSKTKSFYLVGGTDEVIQKTIKKLNNEYPGVNILNYRNGFFEDQKGKFELIEDVGNQKPDFVFVAMGSPKQEELMLEMSKRHKAVYMGLGGSFDVYVGNVNRAPKWWVRNNLEWAYRLYKQPKRIFRQYVYIEFFVKLKLKKL